MFEHVRVALLARKADALCDPLENSEELAGVEVTTFAADENEGAPVFGPFGKIGFQGFGFIEKRLPAVFVKGLNGLQGPLKPWRSDRAVLDVVQAQCADLRGSVTVTISDKYHRPIACGSVPGCFENG